MFYQKKTSEKDFQKKNSAEIKRFKYSALGSEQKLEKSFSSNNDNKNVDKS